MTTPTTQRRPASTRARPAVRPDDEHPWTPVAVAFSTTACSMFVAMLIRKAGLAPGLALLLGVVMAVIMIYTGRVREPRPLALRSIVFRAVTMLTAGAWVWLRTADFTGLSTMSTAALYVTGASVLLLGCAAFALRKGLRMAAAALAGAAGMLFITASGLSAASHSVFDVFTTAGPLDKHNIIAWLGRSAWTGIVMVAPLTVLGARIHSHETHQDQLAKQAFAMMAMSQEKQKFQTLLQDVLHAPNVTVFKMVRWDNGAGETYYVDTSLDGVVAKTIENAAETLATRLALPKGCGVEVIEGDKRGQWEIRVETKNLVKDSSFSYPLHDLKPGTIYAKLRFGVKRSGEEIGMMIREASVYLWGQKRRGKTTTLYALITSLAQCTDALIWVVDLNKGGAARPFLDAYFDGRQKRPIIDWVAGTIEEALVMSEVLKEIAYFRKSHYFYKKREQNVTLLPLDAGLPAIIVIGDEIAEIMGVNVKDPKARQAAANFQEAIRIAGDSGCNMILCGLFATEQAIDRATMAQFGLRVGMGVSEQKEMGYGFDDWTLDLGQVKEKGSGFARVDVTEPKPEVFKGYYQTPKEMDYVGDVCARWRPYLDEPSIENAAGVRYRRRWSRAKYLLDPDQDGAFLDVDPDGWWFNPDTDDWEWTRDPSELVAVAAPAPAAAAPAQPAPVQRPGGQWQSPPRPGGSAQPSTPPPAGPPAGGQPPAEGDDGRGGKVDYQAAAMGPIDDNPPDTNAFDPQEAIAAARAAQQRLADAAAAAGGKTGEEDIEQFVHALDNPEIDWENPETWPAPGPAPENAAALEDENYTNDKVIEACVRLHGPSGIAWSDLEEAIRRGGPWGPALTISVTTLRNRLNKGKGAWLADRVNGAPYVHRDC